MENKCYMIDLIWSSTDSVERFEKVCVGLPTSGQNVYTRAAVYRVTMML